MVALPVQCPGLQVLKSYISSFSKATTSEPKGSARASLWARKSQEGVPEVCVIPLHTPWRNQRLC